MANPPQAVSHATTLPRHVLVVDDDPARRRALCAELGREGIAVYEAADGLSALEVLSTQPIEALLSEVLGPDKHGYRLCCALRQNPQYRRLPLVVCTDAAVSGIDREVALDMGADFYLSKPATTPDIVDALHQAAGHATRRTAEPLSPEQEIELLKSYSRHLVDKLEERTAQLLTQSRDLRESDVRFQQLVHHLDDVFWLAGSDALLYLSPSFERVWGRTREELDAAMAAGHGWVDWIHPDDRHRVQHLEQQLWDKGRFDVQYRIIRPNGAVRWLNARAFVVPGDPPRVAGITRDITEEKLARDAEAEHARRLAESEARFLRMADSIEDIFWLLRDDIPIYINAAAFERIYGRPVDAAYGGQSEWMQWIHPDDRPETARRFADFMHTGRVSNVFRIIRPDGEIRWLHGRGHYVSTEADGSVLSAGAVRDITEEKKIADLQAEQARRQALIAGYGQYALNATAVSDVYTEGIRLLHNTLGADCVVLYAADLHAGRLQPVIVHPHGTRVSELDIAGNHHPGLTFRTGETAIDDLRAAFANDATPCIEHVVSAIGIPLARAERRFGVLGVYAERPHAFGELCRQFARNVANIIAATMARSNAEAALRHSEERLRMAAIAGGLGLWRWDLRTQDLYWNDELRAMYGVSRDAPVSFELVTERLHRDDLQRFLTAVEQCLHEGKPFAEEFRVVLPDGRLRWLTGRGATYTDEQGQALHMEGVTLDITAQKEADEQLRRSEERLRLAIAAGRLGVWRWNLCTDRLDASPRVYELLGIPTGTPLNNTEFMNAIHASDRPDVDRALERHLQHGEPYDTQYRIRHRDGTVRWIESRGAVSHDRDGNPLHIEGVVIDITRQKQIEQDLRQSEERLRLAVTAGRMGAWHVDIATGRAYLSPDCVRIVGTELHSMTDWERVVHPEDRDRVLALTRDVFATGGHYEAEYRIVWPDRSVHWIATYGHAYKNEQGEPVRAEGVVQDITERKNAEEEIRTLTEELEQRVAERTLQLETAMQQLESFSYSISHDLRAPLRAINGFASILREELDANDSHAVHHCIETITRNSERMSQLIDGLLAFARLGQAGLDTTLVDMSALAHEVTRELKVLEPDRDIDVRIEPLPAARGDPVLLRQALFNLVGNAFKFTRGRSPAHIRIMHEPGEGENVYIVRDNGVGFDMLYVNRLFGIFQRLHSATEFEGTGVGLALTRRIIERHGGRVWVDSRLGEGATFYFSLPAD